MSDIKREQMPHMPFTSIDYVFERLHIPLADGWAKRTAAPY